MTKVSDLTQKALLNAFPAVENDYTTRIKILSWKINDLIKNFEMNLANGRDSDWLSTRNCCW